MPYKEHLTDQQKVAWFMDDNSKVNGQYPVWKANTLMEGGHLSPCNKQILGQLQRGAESRHIPFAPTEAQNASKDFSVCPQNTQRPQVAIWQIPWWEILEHNWQVKLILVAPGELQMDADRNRYGHYTRLDLPGSRCKRSECYEKNRTENTVNVGS